MAAVDGNHTSIYNDSRWIPRSDKKGLSIEEAVELVNERIVDSIAQEIAREERYSLRDERKQPWSVRTRRPFRGVIDKAVPTLKEELEFSERVVMELGLPWKESNSVSENTSWMAGEDVERFDELSVEEFNPHQNVTIQQAFIGFLYPWNPKKWQCQPKQHQEKRSLSQRTE